MRNSCRNFHVNSFPRGNFGIRFQLHSSSRPTVNTILTNANSWQSQTRRNQSTTSTPYTANPEHYVTETQYLGITIKKDLNWNQHIPNNTNKANRALGSLRCNLSKSINRIQFVVSVHYFNNVIIIIICHKQDDECVYTENKPAEDNNCITTEHNELVPNQWSTGFIHYACKHVQRVPSV